jgi:hypothetical protein
MSDILTGITSWLGDNPIVFVFVLGVVVGYFLGKR